MWVESWRGAYSGDKSSPEWEREREERLRGNRGERAKESRKRSMGEQDGKGKKRARGLRQSSNG